MCCQCCSDPSRQISIHVLTYNFSKLNISVLIKFIHSVLQVALRIRPLSDAEQEEAATIVAHRVDDQVRWPSFILPLCVCVSNLFTSVYIQYACT